jgi:hypothetical protein
MGPGEHCVFCFCDPQEKFFTMMKVDWFLIDVKAVELLGSDPAFEAT